MKKLVGSGPNLPPQLQPDLARPAAPVKRARPGAGSPNRPVLEQPGGPAVARPSSRATGHGEDLAELGERFGALLGETPEPRPRGKNARRNPTESRPQGDDPRVILAPPERERLPSQARPRAGADSGQEADFGSYMVALRSVLGAPPEIQPPAAETNAPAPRAADLDRLCKALLERTVSAVRVGQRSLAGEGEIRLTLRGKSMAGMEIRLHRDAGALQVKLVLDGQHHGTPSLAADLQPRLEGLQSQLAARLEEPVVVAVVTAAAAAESRNPRDARGPASTRPIAARGRPARGRNSRDRRSDDHPGDGGGPQECL